MSLEGHVALVTGASSGLGRALASELARRGAQVHAWGRNAEALAALGPQVKPALVDLEDEAAVQAALGAWTGPLHLLVHAAGVVDLGPVESSPLASLDWQYRVNLRAPFLLTQCFLPRLIEAQGQIVFLNSGAGLNARAGWSQYAMTKFGLKALADALREEVKPKGVRVMSVYPGRTATPMQLRVRNLEGQGYQEADYLQPTDVSHLVAEALCLPRTADVIDLNIRPN